MTTRLSLFDSPLFLGFDHFEQTFDRLKKSAGEGYPPYNIEQISENILRISIAVAGFEKNELKVNLEGNQLIIRGGKSESDTDKIFIHRGIATRQFQRRFIIAEGIEVNGASIENGLLNIDLSQPISQEKSKTIEIDDKPKHDEKRNLINLNVSKK